eukprot:3363089-Heterocapsa_arctica.AAC.1
MKQVTSRVLFASLASKAYETLSGHTSLTLAMASRSGGSAGAETPDEIKSFDASSESRDGDDFDQMGNPEFSQ